MVGISIFPGMEVSLEDNISYLRKCKKYGINLVFTSMHIPEANEDKLLDEFSSIMKECKKLEMEVIVDISKKYYDKYNWENYNIYALRLDFGFTDEEIVELSNKFPIQLNASTVNLDWFERIEKKGLNKRKLTVCHNYYPRKDTGISLSLLEERNEFFKKLGFSTMAFVQGSKVKRGPLHEGLPTCEGHRDESILFASQELIYHGTDVIIIGDSMGTDEEIEKLSEIKSDFIVLPVKIFNISQDIQEVLKKDHKNRLDAAENVIRVDRLGVNYKLDVFPENTIKREEGNITIDNKNYLRYEGEIQILLKDLPQDNRVNVIGKVLDTRFLKFITPGKKFKFIF